MEEMENKPLFRTRLSTIKSIATCINPLERLPARDILLTSDILNGRQAESVPRVDANFTAIGEDGGETKRQKLQRQLDKAAEEISASLQDAEISL